ncbi:MAG: hypothetical protein M3P48_09395, partial [Actinomycetota bacterium]|nr:hypothetical protein [Actinomycetota bacterium]
MTVGPAAESSGLNAVLQRIRGIEAQMSTLTTAPASRPTAVGSAGVPGGAQAPGAFAAALQDELARASGPGGGRAA